MTPAQKIQKQITDYCRIKGWYYNKVLATSKAGFPDVIIVNEKQVYFIEVKAGNDRQSKLQEYTEEKINSFGNYYYIAKSFEDFLKIVEV